MNDIIQQGWDVALSLGDETLGLLMSLTGALILYLFRLRPKLVFGLPHSSRHILNLADSTKDEPENLLEVYNEQFFLSNSGRRPARDIEVVLSAFPRNIAVNPPCDWTAKNVENGHCQITIPFIAANELMTIDCIYLNQRAAFVSSVRCDESVGKMVDFWTVRKLPAWVNYLIFALLILGMAFAIQLVIGFF